ncbi:hypothetical protein OUZ56_014181 [Daphnia magna]|uniref:chitin synthase n=1 Tax=Daphnia magna TaxID=35525 RepID=A0ABQ9Z962_9CRUS|nr:hypothetical protein OUZ56_014181 [Daphnia magna]
MNLEFKGQSKDMIQSGNPAYPSVLDAVAEVKALLSRLTAPTNRVENRYPFLMIKMFYDCCEHFIEPVLQRHKLMLVFYLIWTNAKIEIPPLKQIKKAIKSWLYNPLLNSRKKDETQPVIHSDCSPSGFLANSSPTIATEAFFIKNYSLNSEADFYHSEEVLKENILFLVLNEKYDEKFLSFELLQRRDRVFAEALLQCSCLDVHLALAKRKIQNVRRENSIDVEQFESVTNPEKGKVFEVSHFIDSNNVTRNLSIKLNWDEQYVGTIQPDQEKMANKEDCERQVEIDQTSSHYDYGWAREEGLDLLRILGSNFEEKINGGVAYCECNFEGIQNEEVATSDYKVLIQRAVAYINVDSAMEGFDTYQITYHTVANLMDPGFKYHLAVARLMAELTLSLSESVILPFDVPSYASFLEQDIAKIESRYKDVAVTNGATFEHFRKAVAHFRNATEYFTDNIIPRLDITNPLAVRKINDQLMQLERGFVDPHGLPGRPEFNHIVFAPSSVDKYSSDTFAGLVDLFKTVGNQTEAEQPGTWPGMLFTLYRTWITLHTWEPVEPDSHMNDTKWYNSLLIDHSFNLSSPRYRNEGDVISGCTANCTVTTRIFAVATIWHESSDEMMAILRSIFRMDNDQSKRRDCNKVIDPYLYHYETHIFFDDAFESSTKDRDASRVANQFVNEFIAMVDKVNSQWTHSTSPQSPTTSVTPYGGRLVWILPGNTKMAVHLKGKMKIRIKKRWSQVMYIDYLIRYEMANCMDMTNVFLLSLDGDMDFRPKAVHVLVDRMNSERDVGIVCNRSHPIGSAGAMVWYQIFEYAIGFWLLKPSEDLLGSILCASGCFSLIRASVLLDEEVMNKFTALSEEAHHMIQRDQGEDRWLCTLLIKRGYRLAYSANSSAYTHCPETFEEFYNQRRRWALSLIANTIDVLWNCRQIVKMNPNISWLYIVFQLQHVCSGGPSVNSDDW